MSAVGQTLCEAVTAGCMPGVRALPVSVRWRRGLAFDVACLTVALLFGGPGGVAMEPGSPSVGKLLVQAPDLHGFVVGDRCRNAPSILRISSNYRMPVSNRGLMLVLCLHAFLHLCPHV